VRELDMPATAGRIWRAIQEVRAGGSRDSPRHGRA
jgi:hypothetical protein